jgi:hypothetical protein
MLHLTGSAFTGLLRTCRQSAFHLEVHDSYGTPAEDEPFRRFLDNEPDDYEWLSGWLEVVRDATARGVSFTRVRVVTEPHVDYTRWGLVVASQNIDAGEDIRYLARHHIDSGELATDDYWLIDDVTVAFTLFAPSGAAAGAAISTDPVIVERCREVRDTVWRRAVAYDRYVRAHSER